jgi:XTP/dITP diphosphohydrolase
MGGAADSTKKHSQEPLTLIAGLTRNLPNGWVSFTRSGDGGCSSAMRVKSVSVVFFYLKTFISYFCRPNRLTMDERLSAFKRLLDIMEAVRAGCPWDSTQTIQSLRHLTIEETYELSQAILNNDLNEVKKELGDLMLHLVFYAKIGQEQGAFDIADVLNGICDKMIVRHPHIFGNEHVENAEQVEQNWEKIKLEREHNRSVLGGVPEGLPSLLKAYRMHQKTAGVGFRWPDAEQAWQKVEEEKAELFAELQKPNNTERIEEEYGDLLFALAAYGIYIGINPDDALEKTNKKFRERFAYVEQKAREQGKGVQHLTLEEMIAYWKEAKSKL